MAKIKSVLFDFDGTIVDTIGAALDIYNKMADQKGYKKIKSSEVPAYKKMGVRKISQELNVPFSSIPSLAAKLRKQIYLHMRELRPVDGLKEALLDLYERGTFMGIVTSNSKKNVKRFLKANDLEVFQFIHCDKSIWGKARVLKKVFKKYKIAPHEACYIGDEVRDFEASAEVEIPFNAVTWGLQDRELFVKHGQEIFLDHPSEIAELVPG